MSLVLDFLAGLTLGTVSIWAIRAIAALARYPGLRRRPRYRIVTDAFRGYEVQWLRWWTPGWKQCGSSTGSTNSHATLEAAKRFAALHAAYHQHNTHVVMDLGYPSEQPSTQQTQRNPTA